jgi:hypothetical protein
MLTHGSVLEAYLPECEEYSHKHRD